MKSDEHLEKLKRFLFQQNRQKLPQIILAEGDEIFFSGAHLIIRGEVELFLLRENGEYIKALNLNSDDFIVGLGPYFGIEKITTFFIAKSEVTLIKLPNDILNEFFKDVEFINGISSLFFERLIEISFEFLIRGTASGETLIRHILKKECDKSNKININNIMDFVDKHCISRSLFYKELKKFERLKEIKKSGSEIKVLTETTSG